VLQGVLSFHLGVGRGFHYGCFFAATQDALDLLPEVLKASFDRFVLFVITVVLGGNLQTAFYVLKLIFYTFIVNCLFACRFDFTSNWYVGDDLGLDYWNLIFSIHNNYNVW
jgi:hypothetical protein